MRYSLWPFRLPWGRSVEAPRLAEELRQERLRSKVLAERLATLEEEHEALREREARFRILSELISDSCWVRWEDAGGESHRIWVNDAFETLTGYSPREFEAVGRTGLVHPDDLESALHHVDGSPGLDEHEFRIVRKDGQVRWLREKMRIEQQGDAHVVLGATQDVTAQKEAERLLREGNRILERRIQERTRELEESNRRLQDEILVRRDTEEALRQARDAAQEASQAKSRFLANMSHEMRTPLNGVLGIAERLLRSDLPPTAKSQVQMLSTAADALLTLIASVLDFSKIEADKLTLEVSDFSLGEVERQVVGLLDQRATAKGLALRWHRDEAVPERLRGDAGRLRQILINLADNAIKFTEQGDVQIDIAIQNRRDRRDRKDRKDRKDRRDRRDRRVWLRFAVRDTGLGITPEVAENLFQPFFQGDDSTARRFGGTGLGLAICRRLVELMDGEIRLDSVPGEGSTFTAVLPFQVPGPPLQDSAPLSPNADALPALGREHNILVAEDNVINQTLLSLQLEALGVSSRVVANGAEALAAWQEGDFALILMDCQMPELDGYEAARRIRSSEPPGQCIPIVGITASAIQEDLDRCYAAGMNAVLSKPYREDQLREALARWLPKLPESAPPSTDGA